MQQRLNLGLHIVACGQLVRWDLQGLHLPKSMVLLLFWRHLALHPLAWSKRQVGMDLVRSQVTARMGSS